MIQLAFFTTFPAAFSAAFMGVKYIAEQIFKREVIAIKPFVSILIALLVFTVLFGSFFCPLGAVFSWLPMLSLTTFNRDKEQCIKGCKLCINTCPAALSLGEADSKYGDCFQCGRCSVKCPKKNMKIGFKR